jgi:hypothetical protein
MLKINMMTVSIAKLYVALGLLMILEQCVVLYIYVMLFNCMYFNVVLFIKNTQHVNVHIASAYTRARANAHIYVCARSICMRMLHLC